MVGLYLDVKVLLVHSLFSVQVNVYSTQRRLFAYLGEMPAKGLPTVVEIPVKALSARRSVGPLPRVEHVTHLWGVSALNCQTNPCERAVKSAGTEYVDLAFRGLTFIPLDYAPWLLRRDAYRPLNIIEALTGLFPLLTGREPPFEEAIDLMQFAYTTDLAGAYVAPASTVLAQSAVAEGGELFLALLAHLRRRYPEVYGSVVATCWEPELREIQIGETGGLISGNSVHSSIKIGVDAGRFTNLCLARMNNSIPNLTIVCLDTPLVGPTPDPLEYFHLPCYLGQSRGYPLISTGGGPSTGGFKRRPPPPSYSTPPRMHLPTGQAQPRRVMQPATGHDKTFGNLATRGEPLGEICLLGLERPNPPMHAYGYRGGGARKRLVSQRRQHRAKNKIFGK